MKKAFKTPFFCRQVQDAWPETIQVKREDPRQLLLVTQSKNSKKRPTDKYRTVIGQWASASNAFTTP